MSHYYDARIAVHYFVDRDGLDSNPDSDSDCLDSDSYSRKKVWIRFLIHGKRSGFGFGFGFEMPGFAHHWSTSITKQNLAIYQFFLVTFFPVFWHRQTDRQKAAHKSPPCMSTGGLKNTHKEKCTSPPRAFCKKILSQTCLIIGFEYL